MRSDATDKSLPARPWLPLFGLTSLVIVLVAIVFVTPHLRHWGGRLANAPGQLLGGILAGLGAALEGAVKTLFVAVGDSADVRQRLGEPLTFPKIQDVAWPQALPGGPQQEITFTYPIQGSRGGATVTATIGVVGGSFEMTSIVVAPDDGSDTFCVPVQASP